MTPPPISTAPATVDILDQAREQVLERGVGLTESQVLDVLRLDDDRLEDLLALAHDVRMKWCGPEGRGRGHHQPEDGRLP